MRALSVMSLLVAGASAGIVLSDHSTIERIGRKLGMSSVLASATTEPAGREQAAQESGARSWSQRIFSPQQPLTAQRSASDRPVAGATASALPSPAQTVADAGSGAPKIGADVETVTVLPRAPGHVPAPVPAQRRETASRVMDEAGRANLARDIQAELRRVGCYDGIVDSDWGPAAKRSMKAFTERINAVLPVEQPDHILLTLVKGHRGKACGAGCAVGEVTVDGGRCVAKPVVAQQPAMRLEPRQVATAQRPRASEPAQGGTVGASWSSSTTVVASPAPAPATAPAPVQITTMSPRAAAVSPQPALPGRMAVGGPTGGVPSQEPAAVGPPEVMAASPRAADGVAQPPTVGVESPTATAPVAPAPAPKKKASGGGSGYRESGGRESGGYERTFKNPKVVREFFFGSGG